MTRPAGSKTDDFRKTFNWMVGRFKKLGLEIGQVQVDVENNCFTILTPEAAKADVVDEFSKWEKQQARSNDHVPAGPGIPDDI